MCIFDVFKSEWAFCEFRPVLSIVGFIHRVYLKLNHWLFRLKCDNWIRLDSIFYKWKLVIDPIKPKHFRYDRFSNHLERQEHLNRYQEFLGCLVYMVSSSSNIQFRLYWLVYRLILLFFHRKTQQLIDHLCHDRQWNYNQNMIQSSTQAFHFAKWNLEQKIPSYSIMHGSKQFEFWKYIQEK